jgi:hypothetical protein
MTNAPLIFSNKISLRQVDFWIAFVFLVGVALRCIHYFGRSSMWMDELASAFNISERSFYQLATESLDFNQVAPLGFLWLQKLSTLVFGVNDHAFRFFPFVLSLWALVFFLAICRSFLEGIPLLGAFTVFSLSIAMVFYGGESKQYSGDVTASLFLVWSSLRLTGGRLSPSLIWVISLAGSVLIFCSMPAVVIAPFVLLVVLIHMIKRKSELPLKHFALVACCWALACMAITYYAKFVISTDTQEAMSDYWSRGFAPYTGVIDFLVWIPLKIQKELSFSLAWFAADIAPQLGYIAWALLALSIPGTIFLVKRSGVATLILFSPVIVALMLAILHVLPFNGRISIYASWPWIITGMAGVEALRIWAPKVFVPAFATVLVLIVSLPVGLLMAATPELHPPYNGQSAQPVLRELKKQMQPGDILYVYFKSRYAIRFYGPKEGIHDYVAGRGYSTVEPILRDIDSLRGNKRVWFFFTQWTPKQPFPDSIKSYMGSVIGKQIGYIPDPDGNTEDVEAAAHLYDLSFSNFPADSTAKNRPENTEK